MDRFAKIKEHKWLEQVIMAKRRVAEVDTIRERHISEEMQDLDDHTSVIDIIFNPNGVKKEEKRIKSELKSARKKRGKLDQEIQDLEWQYVKEEHESDLPILLFVIEEISSITNPETEGYEFVFYHPDWDKVDYLISKTADKDTLLKDMPHILDLTELFKCPTMAKGLGFMSYLSSTKQAKINEALTIIRTKIEELFATQELDSWNQLRTILENDMTKDEVIRLTRLKD